MAERDAYMTVVNEQLHLHQSRHGLSFGTDAFLLSCYVRSTQRGTAYDLGCGFGPIALLCASRGSFSHIYALDYNEKSVALTERNIAENGFSNRVSAVLGDVRTYRLPKGARAVDCVLSNPPYYGMGSGLRCHSSESEAARRETEGTIADFCSCAGRLLRHGGSFLVVYPPQRAVDLFSAMREAHIEPKRLTMVYPTAAHRPCLLLAEGKKGAAPGLFVTKPLILSRRAADGTVSDTEECRHLYENGAFDEQYQKP